MTLERRLVTAVVVFGALCAGNGASAGNSGSTYLGNEAPLQAGAMAADARGGGAIWYNPAGLASIVGLRLDMAASAYTLRFGEQPKLRGARPDAEVTHLEGTNLEVIPSVLTATQRLGRVGLGFGVFVPSQRATYLRVRIVEPPVGTSPGVDLGIDSEQRIQDYFAGPSLGVAVTPALRVGCSLFVTYRALFESGSVNLGISTPDAESGASAVHETLDSQQLGGQLVLGIQWQSAGRWALGATFRLPALRVYRFEQSVSEQATASPGSTSYQNRFVDGSGKASAIVSPARAELGVSREVGSWRVALELSRQAEFQSAASNLELRPVNNGRLGLRYRVTPTWALGGGVFTDRSAEPPPREFGESRLDFYGITVGTEIGSRYPLAREDGAVSGPPGELVFGTTVALSYALGRGSVVQGRVGYANGELLQSVPTDVTAHEVTLHVGSSFTQ